MIKKVLIAEDHQSSNISIQKTLEEMGIGDPDYVYYCDDALVRIQKAKEIGEPYDLLITDLYFDQDHRSQKIGGGAALIDAAREAQPELRILVFSAEGKVGVIGPLYDLGNIDGFVRKGRNDARELKVAIDQIGGNERYFPRFYLQATRQEDLDNFTSYDIKIISLIADGMKQKDISEYLEQHNVKPSGLSTIEKRLNFIRSAHKFSNNAQLVAYCKGLGLI
jgi:two-component system, NarL family, captular synthesis response regulator RcsB